jgi:hypothetical protein
MPIAMPVKVSGRPTDWKNMSSTPSKYKDSCEISSSHGGEYEVQNLL